MPVRARGVDLQPIREDSGIYSLGRAITKTLRVSPNGNNKGGSSWTKAYRNIPTALNAASTDPDDCTLILISPHDTFYDINRTGDPTWTGNYEIRGTHRAWAAVRNNHVGATSVFNFSGKVSIENLAIFTTGSVNGVCFSSNGWRVKHCGFNSQALTGVATSIHADGSGALIRGGKIEDTVCVGNVTHTTAYQIEQSGVNIARELTIHSCLVGIHIIHSDSSYNEFYDCDIGDCALGVDIDAGNEQHFKGIVFHHNTLNVDDEVGNHIWANIEGQLPVTIEPVAGVNYAGVTVNAGEDTWGVDTELRAALTSTKPFRIVGYRFEPSEEKKFMIRFSADSGDTFFDMALMEVKKNKAQGAAEGTEFIFNAGTRISASAGCEAAGKSVQVWLEIQEI